MEAGEEGGAQLVLREARRRRLFWVDPNAITLFYSWLRSPSGKSFQDTLDGLYRRCGIVRRFCFLDELRSISFSSTPCSNSPSMRSYPIHKVRYDVWELAASEEFEFFGAAFLRLALSLSRYADLPDRPATDKGWSPRACFWNRPAFAGLMVEIKHCASLEDVPHDDTLEAVYCVLWDTKPATFAAIETERSGTAVMVDLKQLEDVFDVTEVLCQLFYTWLLVTKKYAAVNYVKEELHKYCSNPSNKSADGFSLPPGVAKKNSPLLQLALSFVLNVKSSSQAVPLSPSKLEQLATWVRARPGAIMQGDNPFTPVAAVPAPFISAMIEIVKASSITVGGSLPDLWSSKCSELIAKVELHLSVVELEYASSTVARLFCSWLRCPGGRFKHDVMVRQINHTYRQRGWQPCVNGSLVQEVRSALALEDSELAAAKCSVWLQHLPCGIQTLRLEKSFVNLIAAVSRHGDEEDLGECSWALLDEIRYWSAAGGYRMLKPRLPVPESGDDGGVNEVIFYLVEELRFWKRLDIWREWGVDLYYNEHPSDGLEFDVAIPRYSKADCAGSVTLPDASRESVEHHLSGPTIALCRDVTEPVLRLLSAWQQRKCVDGSRLGEDDFDGTALRSLVCCSNIHNTASNTTTTTTTLSECDVVTCKQAASDDHTKVVAVVAGTPEVAPLLHKMLEELQAPHAELLSKQLCQVGLT